jgi:hypothetical protein
MKIYEDYAECKIDKSTFISVLSLIQSFTFRRFILALPTNALNKIFMNLYDKVEIDNYLNSIQKSLLQRAGVQRFPRNTEVIDALRIKDVYNIKSKNRTYLLERLENFQNNEPVMIEGNTDITIEHIFPQNPDPKWKLDLSAEDYNYIKENYLNTIGNLTLSGNNGKLGNKSFTEKRNLPEAGYKDSRLWLNKYLAMLDKWDKSEIEKRYDLIAERFLKIWEIPNITIDENDEDEEINIFDAEDPTGKRLEYAIFFNEKIEKRWIAEYYTDIFKKLFELQSETFFEPNFSSKIRFTKIGEELNLRNATSLNDTYFIETGYSAKDLFDRIKYALTIFGFEDELSIKYAD